jgi:hypothetical protein
MRDRHGEPRKASKAETMGGIVKDFIPMGGGRSERALVQDEDMRGNSQEL